MAVDPLAYYHLEQYLFTHVTENFRNRGVLDAVEFFSIVRWKANRSISRIAARLLRRGFRDYRSAVRALTQTLAHTSEPKEKLRLLMIDWKFRLPVASAILTVCYPEEFTVYEVRVGGILRRFHELAHRTRFETLWEGYQKFVAAVRWASPARLSLRDKDRWPWGQVRISGPDCRHSDELC